MSWSFWAILNAWVHTSMQIVSSTHASEQLASALCVGPWILVFSCPVYAKLMYVGMYLFLNTRSCDLVLEIVNKPPSLQPSFEDCVLPAVWCTPHEPIMRSSAPSKPYRRPWSWLGDYLQVVAYITCMCSWMELAGLASSCQLGAEKGGHS